MTSQHGMLKMYKGATRILATITGVGNAVDARSGVACWLISTWLRSASWSQSLLELQGQLTPHPVYIVRQRILQDMHLMVTGVVTILLAAWLLMRIVIPVCATKMTSQVLELLLEHKIHLPGSRTKFRPGKYLLCCSRAVPLQESGVAWFGWHNAGRRDSNRRHGLNHCWSCRNHASSGVQLCVHVSTCTIARSGMFLPAAWLLKRIMIPVCAADMTSHVLRLLLKHQMRHPPESQTKILVWTVYVV